MTRGSLPPIEDDFVRALLGSAETDSPSRAAYVKAAATLGVGLGVGASLPVVATTIGAAGVAGVARWSSWLSSKVLLIGVSGGLLVGGGALLLRPSPNPPSSAQRGSVISASSASLATRSQQDAPAQTEPAPSTARSLERSVAASATPSPPRLMVSSAAPKAVVRALPSAASRAGATTPASKRVARALPARASSDSSLAEQVQSLDRARLALAGGDSSGALGEIAHYRATWPDGVFLTEASVLEVEALAARGERASAQARAADFVQKHPDSPQADRLRALIPEKKR